MWAFRKFCSITLWNIIFIKYLGIWSGCQMNQKTNRTLTEAMLNKKLDFYQISKIIPSSNSQHLETPLGVGEPFPP